MKSLSRIGEKKRRKKKLRKRDWLKRDLSRRNKLGSKPERRSEKMRREEGIRNYMKIIKMAITVVDRKVNMTIRKIIEEVL